MRLGTKFDKELDEAFINHRKSFIIDEDNGRVGERFTVLVTYKHVCLSNIRGFRPMLPNFLAVSVDAIHLCMIADGKLFYHHPMRDQQSQVLNGHPYVLFILLQSPGCIVDQ